MLFIPMRMKSRALVVKIILLFSLQIFIESSSQFDASAAWVRDTQGRQLGGTRFSDHSFTFWIEGSNVAHLC